jgi:hypothetical protein
MKKKIGWQKYEDFLEKQLSSPLLNTIIQNVALQHLEDLQDSDNEEEEEEAYESNHSTIKSSPMIPITNQLIEDVTMMSSFDCWIGHTNFDITYSIKDILNTVPGIELLKICSRYRFFIGVGQMFDFKNVRHDVEKAIIRGDIENDKRLFKPKD